MAQRELLPHAAQRAATAPILLALVGTAGCMSWQPAVASSRRDVVTTIDPRIDPDEHVMDRCQQFACEP